MFSTVVSSREFDEKERKKRTHGECRMVGAAMV